MFQTGEFIIHGGNGICSVKGVTVLAMDGVPKGREYYVLRPQTDVQGTIYVPVENPKTKMRKIMSREEAETLLEETPKIKPIEIEAEKSREAIYRECMLSCDSTEWMRLIKTIYERKQCRSDQGKKITSMDEQYMKKAENSLYSELAAVFGIAREAVPAFISKQMPESETNILEKIN